MDLFVDFANAIAGGLSIPPASKTANTNGTAIDMINGDVRSHAIVNLGALADNAVFSVQIQGTNNSDVTNATFANLADAGAASGNLNTANAMTTLSFQREYRYLRARAVLESGGANAAALIGVVILTQKKMMPSGATYPGYDRSPST